MKHLKYFEGMKPLEVTEALLLAAMVMVLPHSWFVATRFLVLWVVNTIAKVIVNKKVGNPALCGIARWSLWMMACFYLFCLFTLVYSSNMEYGLRMLTHRLPLLLFPLCCLASDMRWLDATRRRLLLWLLPISLAVRCVVRCVAVFLVGHSFVFGTSIDPVHHTYMSMYLLFALGFIYSELVVGWKGLSCRQFSAIAVCAVLDLLFLVLVFSRTGMLGLVLLIAAIVLHQLFVLKNVRTGIAVAVVALLIGAGAAAFMPESGHRLAKTFGEVGSGDMSDIRIWLYRDGTRGVVQRLPFGVGVGDALDALAQAYSESENERVRGCTLNAHNIFIDAAMAMGLPGFLLLLSILVLPAVLALHRSDLALLAYVFAVTLTGMFEAILNRQMGLMFVGMFFVVLLGGTWEKKKSGIQCQEGA